MAGIGELYAILALPLNGPPRRRREAHWARGGMAGLDKANYWARWDPLWTKQAGTWLGVHALREYRECDLGAPRKTGKGRSSSGRAEPYPVH